ncbi:MAG: Smr/MutS family protein [Muribaculaceae bacterium]|nr:Smr/MutS family protein [Muribaculaceae bacterium]
MIYPKDFESKIGFDSIRNLLYEKCGSRLGKLRAANMSFSTDFESVIHMLSSVKEMLEIREGTFPYPQPCLHDVVPALNEMKALGSFISAEKLSQLLAVLVSFADIKTFFDSQKSDEGMTLFPALESDIAPISVFPGLIAAISRVIDKFGEVKDNASPTLYDIRQSIKSAQGSIQRAMRRVIDKAAAEGIIDKDIAPSIRDGRLVLPVAAGSKRRISGIVHDESATGKTVFIEPVEVVEAGNRLRELQLDEQREIIAILIELANLIRPHIEDIIFGCDVIGLLDFISAKADLAADLGASLPHIEDKAEIEWYHAVHPTLFLSLRHQGREVVPLNLTLSNEKRILIISGPNAGGKSVCLKTVAAVQYMMQCGMLPTLYDNSHMGFFKRLLIDIGDEQSLENDLSTYSSHLRNMKFFLQYADFRTLVLADEMGSGTEPQIGGALAQAILQALGKSGCYGVVTTHYQNLKTFADTTPGFINGAMLYDRARLQPTFQLNVGNPGSSFAIDIAHKMGLPNDVIAEAKKIVGEDYVNIDKYLSDITRDRKYWANKRQNIREKENRLDNLLSKYEEVAGDLKAQRKAILDDARKEAKEILSEANARIERTILEIRRAQAEKEKTKQLRKELKDYEESANETSVEKNPSVPKIKELKHKSRKAKNIAKKEDDKKPQPKKEIVPGDYVRLDGGSTPGKVLSVSAGKAEVAFGALRTYVELSRLIPSNPPKQSALASSSSAAIASSEDSRRRQLDFKTEIDVRGMRADEAIQAVTYFIDDAIQFAAGRVRILHGTGHGILKTLIRQQLKANPAVKSFDDEDIRFGGAGITVVELE